MLFTVLYSIMLKPRDFIFINSGSCTSILHLCKLYSLFNYNLVFIVNVCCCFCFLIGRAPWIRFFNLLLFLSQSLCLCWDDSNSSSRNRFMAHTFWNSEQWNTARKRLLMKYYYGTQRWCVVTSYRSVVSSIWCIFVSGWLIQVLRKGISWDNIKSETEWWDRGRQAKSERTLL